MKRSNSFNWSAIFGVLAVLALVVSFITGLFFQNGPAALTFMVLVMVLSLVCPFIKSKSHE